MTRRRVGYEYKDYGEKKSCSKCEKVLPVGCFQLKHDVNKKRGYLASRCKTCSKDCARKRYEKHKTINPFLHKATRAKSRASYLKVPYDLDKEYLESLWTGFCPVFDRKIHLDYDNKDPWSAELDRLIPELGYVKGNVVFLSRKANNFKSNMTADEARKICLWMEKEFARKSDSGKD